MNDRLARKSLAGNPGDEDARPRQPLSAPGRRSVPALAVPIRRGSRQEPPRARWKRGRAAGLCTSRRLAPPGSRSDDWVAYKHWDAGRGGYGAITDFHGYNGSEPRELNEVKDLGMEARVTLGESVETISVALRSGFDRFVLRIPTAAKAARSSCFATVSVSRSRIGLIHFLNKGLWPRTIVLEAAVMDGRFQAAIDRPALV